MCGSFKIYSKSEACVLQLVGCWGTDLMRDVEGAVDDRHVLGFPCGVFVGGWGLSKTSSLEVVVIFGWLGVLFWDGGLDGFSRFPSLVRIGLYVMGPWLGDVICHPCPYMFLVVSLSFGKSVGGLDPCGAGVSIDCSDTFAR